MKGGSSRDDRSAETENDNALSVPSGGGRRHQREMFRGVVGAAALGAGSSWCLRRLRRLRLPRTPRPRWTTRTRCRAAIC